MNEPTLRHETAYTPLILSLILHSGLITMLIWLERDSFLPNFSTPLEYTTFSIDDHEATAMQNQDQEGATAITDQQASQSEPTAAQIPQLSANFQADHTKPLPEQEPEQLATHTDDLPKNETASVQEQLNAPSQEVSQEENAVSTNSDATSEEHNKSQQPEGILAEESSATHNATPLQDSDSTNNGGLTTIDNPPAKLVRRKKSRKVRKKLTFADLAQGFLHSIQSSQTQHGSAPLFSHVGALTKNQSLSPEELRYASYLQKFAWFLRNCFEAQEPFKATTESTTIYVAAISIMLDKDGNIITLNINEPSGNQKLLTHIENIIRKASPYPPLPEHLGKDSFGFNFYLHIAPFSPEEQRQRQRIRVSSH